MSPLASSPMPMRRPDARPPALMAMMPPASSPLIATMPRADPAPMAMMPNGAAHTDSDDADRNQRTQRERPHPDHVRQRDSLGPDCLHVDHAENAEQREDHRGEHRQGRQYPGQALKCLAGMRWWVP